MEAESVPDRQRAAQLIVRFYESRQEVAAQRLYSDEQQAATASDQLDKVELHYHTRLEPCHQERQHLNSKIAAARAQILVLQRDIAAWEQYVDTIDKYEADLESEHFENQQKVVDVYDKARDTELMKRQQQDIDSSMTLIRKLEHCLEEDAEAQSGVHGPYLKSSLSDPLGDFLQDFSSRRPSIIEGKWSPCTL